MVLSECALKRAKQQKLLMLPFWGIRMKQIFNLAAKLSASYTGNGSAAITSVPAGVACNTASSAGCEANFALGTSVTLSIAPSAGTSFLGWTGACTATAASCTVTTDQLLSVRAIISNGILLQSGFENP
jgi:hypothetical protein